jgi:hypothetical protein
VVLSLRDYGEYGVSYAHDAGFPDGYFKFFNVRWIIENIDDMSKKTNVQFQ